MSQITAVDVVEGPEWRTLKGLEAPLRVWGEWHGNHFRTAGDRKQATGEPIVMVRLWSEQRGTARYAETQDGRTVSLGGAATKFWVQAGAGEASVEAPAAAPAAELDEWGARVLVGVTWSAADEFQAERADGRLSGFTFRVGLPHNARYGWIAADGTYTRTLVRTRREAAGLLPAQEAAACPAHRVADERGAHAEALPVPRCEPGVTYGVWDGSAGGVTHAEDCAMGAANWGAAQLAEDPDIELSVIALCGEHEEQPANGCEDCAEEPADDEDTEVVDEASAAEEPVRYFAELESVKAAPGHQEMRLSIREPGERKAVEYYALTFMAGWTAQGVMRAFGWAPLGELEYAAGTERGAVTRTDCSGTPGAVAARAAVREEILARFTVRLACGAAGHFRAMFRLGRAYPIGWTFRVGHGGRAFFRAVTTGGTLLCSAGVLTREEAEEQLKAHDPAAPATNETLRAYIQELTGERLGRAFLGARNGDLAPLPDKLTANAPITIQEARGLVQRTHGQAEEFEAFQGEGGRFLGWTFRCGRLHSSRYGWITSRGTLAAALEPYRSDAGNALVHADRDDQEVAERTAVARSMATRKLAGNRCVHNRYTREDIEGDPVLACTLMAKGETFAVFTADEGVADVAGCAVLAANVAARFRSGELTGDADSEPPFWAKTCPEHAEEVAGRCTLCGQDTPDEGAEEAPAEEAPAPRFAAGDLVVCADGVRRTVAGMAPRIAGEPERVIVEGGLEWIAENCRRANRDDLHAARVRSAVAAQRVRTEPNPDDPAWRAALEELSTNLDFLKAADPLCAILREDEARETVRRVHPEAEMFVPFHLTDGEIGGWSFRTSGSVTGRYGVVTAACEISPVGLYEYRTTAERAHLYGREDSAGRS